MTTTTYLDKLVEYTSTVENGVTTSEVKFYLDDFAVVIEADGCNKLRYLHGDRLGSTDTITDALGSVVERHGYDAFGKPRAGNWMMDSTAGGQLNARLGLYSKVTDRGFTGHEHVDSVGLIHMNGRAYDPELGRFLSVDPFLQFPENSQSLNPYSYILNNPLSGTDSTGYMIDCTFACASGGSNPFGSFGNGGSFKVLSPWEKITQRMQVGGASDNNTEETGNDNPDETDRAESLNEGDEQLGIEQGGQSLFNKGKNIAKGLAKGTAISIINNTVGMIGCTATCLIQKVSLEMAGINTDLIKPTLADNSEEQFGEALGDSGAIVVGGVAGLAKKIVGKATAATVSQVTKGGDDLFRVVDDVELSDIQKTGAFRTTPGAFEGKQFVDNLDDAKALQKKFTDFFGGNQTIVRGQAPQSVIDNASKIPFADIPKGTAITIPVKDVPKIKPKL